MRAAVWLLAATALWAAAMAWHVAGYFFLADDFAFVAVVSRVSPRRVLQVYGDDLFSVYRPHAFALGVLVHPLLGFEHPKGWAALILSLHAGNAWLVARLGCVLGLRSRAAGVAAGFFLAAPWAMEAYLWLSGVFDVLAVTGVLLGTRAAAEWSVQAGRPAGRVLLTALIGCGLAILSKENTFVLPGMMAGTAGFAVLTRRRGSSSGREWYRAAAVVVAALLCVLTYFAIRAQIVSGDSTYTASSYLSQLASWQIVDALGATAWSLVAWPGGHLPPDVLAAYGALRIAVGGILVPVLLVGLAVRRPLLAVFLVGLLALALTPTAFHAIQPETITPRRYLYLAGIPVALALGAATTALAYSRRASAHVVHALFAVTVVVSVVGQVRLWREATALSACAIDAFASVRTAPGQPVVVHDSPRLLGFGPWVVTDYAYASYFASRPLGPVIVGDAYLHMRDAGPTVTTRQPMPVVPPDAAHVWMCTCARDAGCGP